MSENKHTPEPWRIGTPPPNGEQTIGDSKGLMVAVATTGHGVSSEANARRIVACVNACKGIPTDILEHAADFGAAGIQTIEQMRTQRYELLAALERVTEKLAWLNSDDCAHIMALTDEAEALIASVKGGA